MLDIKAIRDHPEAFDAGLAKRGLPPSAASILEFDERRRTTLTRLQAMQQQRNALSRRIGQDKARGGPVSASREDVAALKNGIRKMEESGREAQSELTAMLASLPNLPEESVPEGLDESANVEIRRHGEPCRFDFEAKPHFDLGENLGLMDFERAARISGARFVVLRGALARLERALAAFMLDVHTREFGYTEIAPPLLVREQTAFGTGNLPKFADDLFRVGGDLWLIPTAEMPLTNLVSGEILESGALPLRFTAYTPCFRAEAGAAGKDTRGMIRQHQFNKVELVSITEPEHSNEEHERMTGAAEEILKRLALPYRVVVLSAGEMGFSARKTYDIEVWLPGQGAYREISSCSNCADFQARRMAARYRREGEKATRFVHSLNGSGLAVGRTLIAVMENYQQPDGSVVLPPVLHPYMDGQETISAAT